MTDISVIIVSYNCSSLLMLTLASVRRASHGLNCETIVVDNHSSDDTEARVRNEAPWAHFIQMGRNAGFSAANNEAMRNCSGRNILILNPDTIISANLLRDLVAHLDSSADCGAVGVRMVNGEGRFLGESKRGRTTLSASFFKLSGLWRLAPKSATINAYYIGNVDERERCQAPILSGACMAFRRDLMERVGMFDENYFMYCEDNDLSWRMHTASANGNQYRGDLSIVHFKGQSTPRNRRYIRHFYKSMSMYAEKHEFPNRSAAVNAITRLGIKAAFVLALIRCTLMRDIESTRTFTRPKAITFVSDDEKLAESVAKALNANGTAARHQTFANASLDCDTQATVFDINGDIPAAIEHMRANQGKTMFGFHNPDNGETLIFYNNRCHPI